MNDKEKKDLVQGPVQSEVKKHLVIVRERIEREENASDERPYYNYSVKGKVRNRDVIAFMSPKDKGGYTCLDIVFGDSNEAELIVTPQETVQENGEIIKWTAYTARNVDENGEVYECDIKPFRGSDKTILNMLLNQLK